MSPTGRHSLDFDIIDTGIGLTASQSQRLFSPFQQADTSMSRRFGGTGLGLTISQRLAALLGGDVVLVDSTPGRGTHFRVTIDPGPELGQRCVVPPAAEQEPAPPAPAVATGDSPLSGFRLLLAEDGPDNQRLISFVLRKAGADVTVVENGQLAVEAVQTAQAAGQPFAGILMDMQMPVLDGYGATQELRRQRFNGPILALTAHAMSGDREKCLLAGCSDYATKPIDRPSLIAQLVLELARAPQATA
jgi:CheY-like chemotaxis protein